MKKLLLVEDEAIIAENTSSILLKYGYRVTHTFNGDNAVEIALSDNDVSLILMDIDLGKGINGIEAAEIISKKRMIPIVFLSNSIELETIKKIENYIPYGFIPKSTSESFLIISIITALRLFYNYKEQKCTGTE